MNLKIIWKKKRANFTSNFQLSVKEDHTLAVIFLFIGAELSPNNHSWVLESFKKPPSLLVSMIYKC